MTSVAARSWSQTLKWQAVPSRYFLISSLQVSSSFGSFQWQVNISQRWLAHYPWVSSFTTAFWAWRPITISHNTKSAIRASRFLWWQCLTWSWEVDITLHTQTTKLELKMWVSLLHTLGFIHDRDTFWCFCVTVAEFSEEFLQQGSFSTGSTGLAFLPDVYSFPFTSLSFPCPVILRCFRKAGLEVSTVPLKGQNSFWLNQ